MKDRTKKCCKVRIRYVMMDLIMPVMNGYTATEHILKFAKQHNQKSEPDVYVSGVTAYVDQPRVDKCFDVGMVEVIEKPVNSEKIKSFVNKYKEKE